MVTADSRDPVSVTDIVVALSGNSDRADAPKRLGSAAAEWISPLAGELCNGRYADAVRFVLDGCAHGKIPPDADLSRQLYETAGAPVAARLISAFARFPCRECSNGTDPCPICAGRGIRAQRVVCEHCIGSGMIRCDFCGGSGLGAYDLVPVTLRYPVLLRRVRIASSRAKSLLVWPLPALESDLLNRVWNFNKLLGVLESAVSASSLLAAHEQRIAEACETVWHSCRQTAATIDTALRAALTKLSEVCGAITQSIDSGDSSIGVRKSAFYEALAAANTFRGTCLHHPLLRCK